MSAPPVSEPMDRLHVWTAPRMQEVGDNKSDKRFECGHVSGLFDAACDRWPRWDPRTSPKQRDGVEAPLQSTGCLVRRFDRLSSCCSQASCFRGTDERVRRSRRGRRGRPVRSSSWPTPRGPSCWPEPPPRLSAAAAPAKTKAMPRRFGCPASPIGSRQWRR
jgi:hypothetical protein